METRRLLAVFAAVVLSSLAPQAYGAAQLRAGAATSAKPTAPRGSTVRQMQIQFDPATFTPSATTQPSNGIDFTRAVDGFQLTVGYNSSQVSLVNKNVPDYSNTNFGPPPVGELFLPALYGPYSPDPPLTSMTFAPLLTSTPLLTGIPAGFDTFVTAGGSLVGQPVPGDVNIFSLLFDVDPSVSDADLVKFAIFASPHNTDGTPLNPDFISSESITDPSNTSSNGPGEIETTIIGVSPGGNFVTFQGNTALTPSVVVPLPPAATASLAGLAVAAICAVSLRRKPQAS